MAADNAYVGVRIQGGLLPAELLSRLVSANSTVPGLTSADYGLATGETVREAANRVWAYLTTAWAGYRAQLAKLPATDRGTTLTRDRWLQILLDQLGFGRVQATPAGGILADGKQFPVSHEWGPVPIHLLGARIDLDLKTSGVAGAAGQAPQSMLQELLNRSEPHLWAILSNGSTLRLLRDSTSLVGSAYVEFDLEAIFGGELFSDFLLLFTLVHSTRLAIRDTEIGPASCWLEQWRQLAVEDGSRALDQLRDGVVAALETLGSGFLGHPANADLRARYDAGELGRDDYQHALLRVVYRLLFSFVAEDRGALLSPDATPQARQRYVAYFCTDRLRRTARRRRGGRHGDRWRALQLVWSGLGADAGLPELGLAGIGGLFERGELDFLADFELSNESLLKSVRSLSLVREKRSGQDRVVNYRDLDAEELGSIYEALLEYVPNWNPTNREYKLGDAAGNTRKTTGSYYTPTSLIESLLDSALDPVLDAAQKRGVETGDVEAALLEITVCDPACGSGHFLVAAARRIAKRLAAARTGDPEPPPAQVRTALREVIGRCIYGVDLNPLAAELAKVSLWLEAMEPGKPLAFLDAQIKVGNALIGATPALLDGGLPQEAFKPIEGDDKKVAAALAKRNKEEAGGQGSLFDVTHVRTSNTDLARSAAEVLGARMSLADIHVQQQRLRSYLDSPDYRQAKLHADAWCAAFVWPKRSDGVVCPTTAAFNRLRESPASPQVAAEIERLTTEYRFFHWHLEFPHIFPTDGAGTRNAGTGWFGGFAVVLGNPPWERLAVEDDQYFENRAPWVLETTTTAKRKTAIDELSKTHPAIFATYLTDKARKDREVQFATTSGVFTRALGGRTTTQALFAEASLAILNASGRCGLVLPTGVVTDVPMRAFWEWLVVFRRIETVIDFENSRGIFPGVHRSTKFMLFTANGGEDREAVLRVGNFLRDISDMTRRGRIFTFPLADLQLVNPQTRQLPVCETQHDVDLLIRLTRSAQPGMRADAWVGFTSQGHSEHFVEEAAPGLVPLYEGKLMHQYDASFATYKGCTAAERGAGKPREVARVDKGQPIEARYYASPTVVDPFLDRRNYAKSPWVLVVRDYARSTDERTVIASIVPRTVPIQPLNGVSVNGSVAETLWCLGMLNSFAFDWTARQRMPGPHFNVTIFGQCPIPAPRAELVPLVSSNAYSLLAWDDEPIWLREMGYVPKWDRRGVDRSRLRAESDAAAFLAYGASAAEANYIMETFPIVKRKDIASHGEFRTKRLILEIFDRMSDVIKTGVPYVSASDQSETK